VLIQIGPVAIRWYALAYIAGILLAWRYAAALIRQQALWGGRGPPVDKSGLEDLVLWITLGIIVGGRLGHVLFYTPSLIVTDPIEILRVWNGGMSFHGGCLGVLVAVAVFVRRRGLDIFSLGDMVCAVVPIGLFLGRIANFINGELWGRPTDLPWGVIFPGAAAQTCPQLLGLCARHPSQLYQAALEGLLLALVLLWLGFRRGWFKRPGALMGVFLVGYGIARFLVEFVRQPDAQFVTEGNPVGLALHWGGWGLTMGQLLSLPMIAVGLFFALRARTQ
ncbi:MAG: prolipoprotein diacylglyceryl transferase, partial [Tabrizicola sp.]